MKALIILDNAPYHKVKDTDPVRELYFKGRTISTALKEHLEAYLSALGYCWPVKTNKSELLQVAKQHYGQPPLKIDTIASHYQHQILFTPPYWPEFQPIEEIWGVIKNSVANNRRNFSMQEASELVMIAHGNITPRIWCKTIAGVSRFEKKFNWNDFVPNLDQVDTDNFEEPNEAIELYDSSSESSVEEIEI